MIYLLAVTSQGLLYNGNLALSISVEIQTGLLKATPNGDRHMISGALPDRHVHSNTCSVGQSWVIFFWSYKCDFCE